MVDCKLNMDNTSIKIEAKNKKMTMTTIKNKFKIK